MHRAVLRSRPYRALVLVVVVAVALTVAVTLVGGTADAAITSEFKARFSANVNGSIILRGNTNMVCPVSTTCTAAQAGTYTGTDKGVLNNNNYVMQYADGDSDPDTFNVSTTKVTLPTGGSKVLFAGLYWGADLSAGNSGVAAKNESNADKVLFRTPASAAWQTVTATTLFQNASIKAYQGFADVTALVSGAGDGDFSVANIQAGTGKDRYAGWSLVLAYQNPNEAMHSLRVFDGFGVVTSKDTQVDINVTGFQTPDLGPVNATIGTVVYEGDLGLEGDNLKLDDGAVSDAANPATNFFNSTVSESGTLLNSGRSPGNRNLMGVDVDQFDASGKLATKARTAKLTLTTGGETFYPGVVTFTTDLFAPDLVTTVKGTDADGGDLLPGDEIEYRIDVRNNGSDPADNTVISNAIPTHTTYVPGSMTVKGTPVADTGATPAWNLGSIANGSPTWVTFRVKVDNDTPAGSAVTDVASSSFTAHFTNMGVDGVPGTDIMTVQQPHADLAATLTVSPATVQRAAAPNTVVYTAVVTNKGSDLEPAATAKVTLPTGVTAGPLPSGCSASGQVVTCPAGALVAGSQATLTIPATVAGSAARSAVATLDVSGSGLDAVAGNNSSIATLTVNTAPKAVADTATTTNGTPAKIDVRANDTDTEDAPSDLKVTIGTPPGHGSAVAGADGWITYTPVPGWAGADTVEYVVTDSDGGTATATVTVTTANAAPVAGDDVVATGPGTKADISPLANDSDPNDDPIHVASITQPQSGAGAATLNGDVVTYVPAASFKGIATFTYTVQDSAGKQTVGQIRVTVGNAAPVAAPDRAGADHAGTVTVDVLANDTDGNDDKLRLVSAGRPDHGTATISAGKVVYTAPAGFSGDATFTYVVSDGTDTATGTVTVTVANALPVAAAETVTTPYGTAVTVDVLADAKDPNTTDKLRVSGLTTPAGGTAVLGATGKITYTPKAGFSGADSFDYTITDDKGGLATATVNVTVANGVPVARPDSVTVPAGVVATIDVLANDSDPNRDPLTVTVDVAPGHGTATVGADGKITYTPAAGYRGTDSFHYTVADGKGGTAGATVTLGVVNTAPTARDDAAATDTDTAVTVHPLADDSDENGDTIQLTAVTTPAHGTAVLAADGTIAYTPDAGFQGTDTFTYSITDAFGKTASALVTITVRNAAPIAVDDRFVVHPGVTSTLDLLANDVDPNTGQKLGISSVTQPAKGVVTITADGKVTYRPNAMTTGTDTFDYVLTDDLGRTDTATVTVIIDAAPTAVADTATTASGQVVDIAVTANDTDPGSALTLVSAGMPAHGTATVAGGKIRYTPAAGYTGTDTFTYVIRDAAGSTATGTVTVAVGNADPVAADDATAVLAGKHVDVDVLANDTDPNPGQKLTVTAAGTPAHGTAIVADGKIRYTPAAGYTGTDTFTYTIGDGNGGTARASVTVTVSDGSPVAVPDQHTTAYQQNLTVAVLDNDLDPAGTLGLTAVTTPDHGTAKISGNKIVYTPPAGFSGVATFGYTATDGDGAATSTTVTITVGAPPVVPNRQLTTKAGAPVRIVMPTTDEAGHPITVLSIGRPKHGTASLNADGTVTYTAAAGWSGTDSFTYQAADAAGNQAAGTISITVAGVNTKPAARNDVVAVDAGDSVVIHPLANDKDVNQDKLRITAVGRARHGTPVLNKDGSVTYAPYDSYAGGVDSFTYTISDGHGGVATAIVTVTVNAPATGGKLPKTGLNIVSMVTAGGAIVLVGGFLLMAGQHHGPGRHRPGRHRMT
ncbi:Ig-like domain-containing protein [Actinoplanes sp. NPDC048796]|uniref:Ig-like domain-containing protein n=1 Tax=Actinoplanes sp. NPDC048796 TaxID=3155640 RepID=UPI0033D9AA73